MEPQVPGASERRLERGRHLCRRRRGAGLPARSGYRRDGLLGKVHAADQMILRVGHEEFLTAEGHALRMIELGRGEIAVGPAHDARADCLRQRPVQACDDDAVVVAVGDEEPPAGLVGQDLAGEPQRRILRFGGGQLEAERRRVQQPLAAVVGDRRFQQGVDLLEGNLAAGAPDGIPFRVDQDHRRPGIDPEEFPDGMIGVVDHRVLDVVAEDRLGDVFGIPLGLELGAVDADHHQVVRIGPFELLELRQDVHAINAAVGPEIQEDELAAEGPKLDRAGGVQPGEPGRQRRDLHALLKGRLRHFLPLTGRRGLERTQDSHRDGENNHHHPPPAFVQGHATTLRESRKRERAKARNGRLAVHEQPLLK